MAVKVADVPQGRFRQMSVQHSASLCRLVSGSIGLLFLLVFVNPARAQSPTTQEMEKQIEQLQQKVDRLEAAQPAKPATQPVAQLPPQIASDPLAGSAGGVQASGQLPGAQNLASPLTGGWDGNRFYLRSTDGNFSLHPGLVADFRNDTTYREHLTRASSGEVPAIGYDTQNGFEVTRLRLSFDGNLGKYVDYYFQLAADQGASLTLYDAFGTYHFGASPFSLKAGQFKDPVWHERNLSEANQLTVDRSLIETLLAGGQGPRIQGAAFTYDQDRVRAQLVAHDGFNSINTKFYDAGGVGAGAGGSAGITPTDFGFTVRGEYMVLGNRSPAFNPWTEYDQFTSLHARQNILVLAGGTDYTQAGANYGIFHSVDLQFNDLNGLSIFAAYLGSYRNIHTRQGVNPGSFYDPGFLLQAGWVFNEHIEPFVRYDYTHLAPASTTAISGLASHVAQEMTLGFNYYIYGQKAKFTMDGTYLPNGSPVDADGLGILRDSGHNEVVFRAQFQITI